jgi:hypothetical protein
MLAGVRFRLNIWVSVAAVIDFPVYPVHILGHEENPLGASTDLNVRLSRPFKSRWLCPVNRLRRLTDFYEDI